MIEITMPSVMLAPVDYNVNTATKLFGFKNTLGADLSEPEKFVSIGMWPWQILNLSIQRLL